MCAVETGWTERATVTERCVFVCDGDADDYNDDDGDGGGGDDDDDDKLDGTTTMGPRALAYRVVLRSALEWGAT